MTSPDTPITPITVDDLATTWRTLGQVAGNYFLGSQGEALLVEARRLIEIEIREQHGDQAWARVIGIDDDARGGA